MNKRSKREPLLFVASTYLFSLITWGSLILMNKSPDSGAGLFLLYLLGGLSPTIVALLLPLRAAKDERKAYYRRYFNFKTALLWYVLPVVIALAMKFAGIGVLQLFFRESLQPKSLQPWYMIFPMFLQMIIGGGLEEIGWRGVLVHRYQEKNTVLVALVVGVIWACWHIPLFFIQGVSQYQTSFLPFFVQVIGLSLVTAVLYIRSQSAVPCIIFHAMVNALSAMGSFFEDAPTANLVTDIAKYAVIVLFFLIYVRKPAPAKTAQAAES